MVDLDTPVTQLLSRAELDARRAARRAQTARRRNITGASVVALACLALIPVLAAQAGMSATLPGGTTTQARSSAATDTVAAPTPVPAVSASASAPAPSQPMCPIPASLRPALEHAAASAGIELSLLVAVADTESRFDPQAHSGAGAQGLMQLEPDTAAAYGADDPYNPYESASAGARYLRSLIDRYDGSLTLALAAYNAGPTTVDHAGGVPAYPETIAYVEKVSGLAQTIAGCR